MVGPISKNIAKIPAFSLALLSLTVGLTGVRAARADELKRPSDNQPLKKRLVRKNTQRIVRSKGPVPASYQLNQSITGTSTSTQSSDGPPPPDTQILAKASIGGKSVQDDYRQTRIASFGFGMDLTHQVVARTLEAHIDAGAMLQTGSSQALFYDEYAPYQSIYVTEAVVRWKPVSLFTLTAGAVDQSRFNSPILLDSRSFPGMHEAFRIPMGYAYLELGSEQAIPTSTTLSTHAGDEITTPGFFIEQAKLGFERGKTFSLEGSLGYFSFLNLPRSVAQESRFMGNSVVGVADTGAQYLYGYDGILTGATMSLAFSPRAKWSAMGSYIYNRSAPDGRNAGMHLENSVEFTISDRVKLTPKLDLFRNESDSSPGYYNSPDLGHNNRQGFGTGMVLTLPREQFSLEGKWVNSQVLEQNPFQADMQFIVITLRKSYVLL